MFNLRDYQIESIDGLRAGIRSGHRSQILCAPTGAGKTVIGAFLMHEARQKGSRVAFVVDRVSLVDQTSAVLDSYGIDHGIQQAGHWRRRGYEPIQVCSAQTIEKRGFFPQLDLLIVDEAHAMRRQTINLIKSRPELKVVGLTATPFTKGLGDVYTNIVNVTTTNKLIEDKFLVPVKMYAARSIDMTGAKVVAGEWVEKEIEERGLKIVGDIVAEWIDKTRLHFGGPVKTIVFAATVDHGQELCRQFQAAGYNFQQISYRDANEERRRELIAEFRKADSSIDGLVSCEVFTKGFDVPDVLCGIAARPYRKSLSSHIQQLGRVMRPSHEKDFALWLDHCGNVLRFREDTEQVWAEGVSSLENGERDRAARKEKTDKEKAQICCSGCGFVLPSFARACPSCGKERPNRSLVENVAGVMIEVNGKRISANDKHAFLAKKNDVWAQLAHMGIERKGDMAAAQRWAQAQYRNIYGDFARRQIHNTELQVPSVALQKLVQSNLIRWAKGRAKAA